MTQTFATPKGFNPLQTTAGRSTAGTAERVGAQALSARLPLIGLIAVQLFIGYEWLISGVTKIVRGGFPAGLADELTEKSQGAPGWYTSILDNVVIPNATFFGYLSEIGELLLGVALIGGGLVWLLGFGRLPTLGQAFTLAVIAFSALVGIFLNINFHLANGSPHPWFLPASGFDEGIDLDSLMPMIQAAIAVVTGALLFTVLRGRRGDGMADGS